jgi:hypothetical protein
MAAGGGGGGCGGGGGMQVAWYAVKHELSLRKLGCCATLGIGIAALVYLLTVFGSTAEVRRPLRPCRGPF